LNNLAALSDRYTFYVPDLPCYVVWGAKDLVVPVSQAYAAAELIPDCQLKIFENYGHNVYRDEIEPIGEEDIIAGEFPV
jgi:pimeloyl-ACP methyl ester carboxylesterase